jgi:hypothetical protein
MLHACHFLDFFPLALKRILKQRGRHAKMLIMFCSLPLLSKLLDSPSYSVALNTASM